MATSGTITQQIPNQGGRSTIITGITNSTDTPTFKMATDFNSSFSVSGTFAGASLQWYGSNDGGTVWQAIGVAVSAASGGTFTPGDVFFGLYKGTVSGGDGTTSLNVSIISIIPR